ncbi:hypothetical protein KEM54_001027 [Ascosphaera aggregata]|nr:hypothetical protein KEM54_001027 [Ascosphaera aggregata]
MFYVVDRTMLTSDLEIIDGGMGSSLSDIPVALLRAELLRRAPDADGGFDIKQSSCGSVKTGTYNTPLHIFALILILAISTLATAFVHLLPTAFVSLTDPCLPYFWNKGYPAMPGFVSMMAVFLVVSIEMFFAVKGAAHIHGSEYDTLVEPSPLGNGEVLQGRHSKSDASMRSSGDRGRDLLRPTAGNGCGGGDGYHEPSTDDLLSNASPLLLPKSSTSTSDSEAPDMTLEELEAFPEESDDYHDHYRHSTQAHGYAHAQSGSHGEVIDSPHAAQKQLLQCLLLEAGILFHSVFIGMALSVETGAPFIVLLIAIVFHQTFEGLALGARIAALIPTLFPASSPKPWLMAFAYGATTPLGQAIGLFVHNLYDPQSTTGLLMVGLTNAFSSGLLLFAGLVELLAEDFLSDRSYEQLQGKSRVQACVAVFLGAMLMAFVGAFA